jgi:hypothetical protein
MLAKTKTNQTHKNKQDENSINKTTLNQNLTRSNLVEDLAPYGLNQVWIIAVPITIPNENLALILFKFRLGKIHGLSELVDINIHTKLRKLTTPGKSDTIFFYWINNTNFKIVNKGDAYKFHNMRALNKQEYY